MKSFKIGEAIRFGVYENSIFSSNISDFEASYAPLINPNEKTKILGDFFKDEDGWVWTPVFFIFKAGKYVIHIKSNSLNVKQVFEVIDEFYESNDSEILL